MSIRGILDRLWNDQNGATAIEYCLIIAVLSMGIITAISSFANSTGTMWTNILNGLAAVW